MAAVLTMGVTERRTGAALRLTLHRFRLVTGAEVALVALLVTFSAALPVCAWRRGRRERGWGAPPPLPHPPGGL